MMKNTVKKLAVIIAAATMTLTTVTSVNACDADVIGYVNGVTDFLNVRANADFNARVIGYLFNGEAIEVLGYSKDDNWAMITYNGTTGYVNTAYIGYIYDEECSNTGYEVTDESTVNNDVHIEVDTIAYPRIDRQLASEMGTTWCTLNTDGYYYNEVGARFTDMGNGTFKDAAGNILTVIQ